MDTTGILCTEPLSTASRQPNVTNALILSFVRRYYAMPSPLEPFANYLGTNEAALRLLLTLIAGYPLSILYRLKFHGRNAELQHLYFALSGFCLIAFNYGFDCFHSLFCIFVAYFLCSQRFGGRLSSVIVAYVFFMAYLLAGYWFTATDTYDIKWTMPHCILTLRLMGLVCDVYDGRQALRERRRQEKSGAPTAVDTSKDVAIEDSPRLLETVAYTYFYGSFLVGPQYPLQRFRDFVNGKFDDPVTHGPRDSIVPCLLRLVPGLLYLGAHQLLNPRWSTEFFFTDEFRAMYFLSKWTYMLFWFRFLVFKYQAVWLLTEGICILSGIAYNGDDEQGQPDWKGVRNIRLTKFEFGCTFQSVIESFNYNTNQWAFKYVFKRLRFLGNKNASHLLTLMFLAVWHGFYTGYYGCFVFEFVCVLAERKVNELVERLPPSLGAALHSKTGAVITWPIKKLIVVWSCSFGFLPFAMLTFNRWWQVYKDLYFVGYVLYLGVFPVVVLALEQVLPRRQRARQAATDADAKPKKTQ